MRHILAATLAALCAVAITGCGVRIGSESTDTTAEQPYSVGSMTAPEYAEAPLSGTDLGQAGQFNTEAYDRVYENPFLLAADNPLSTFAIDVDTASYANVRRFLEQGQLPPADAVRIEEFINYFPYDYQPPEDDAPFVARAEIGPCPWNGEHRLARIGLKGKEVAHEKRPAANLVFLLDVSGSMAQPNKLPLLQSAMRMLVENLNDRDRVAIVVYAGASGLMLPPTSCEEKSRILEALDRLQAGGSTNGGAGIQLAYQTAAEYQSRDSVSRVILCTDGDFNVGVTNQGDLIRLIEREAAGGTFLTVLGFGMGNYKDSTLEKLADKGNGNYGYIDTIHEARKLLVEQLTGTLVTIAKDVKIQVDFNPARVAAYRLIGYENRLLRNEDFRDDAKDAGEIGAGHTVTALYELVPAGKRSTVRAAGQSKYQQPAELSETAASDEALTVRLRYKEPQGSEAAELEFPVTDTGEVLEEASVDFRFAVAVAAFGLVLRDSEHKGEANYDLVLELARSGKGNDPNGYREEMIELVRTAKGLGGRVADRR